MQLNDKQKEILVDGIFEEKDLKWLPYSFEDLKKQRIDIFQDGATNWYKITVDGKQITTVNFDFYRKVWTKICKNK